MMKTLVQFQQHILDEVLSHINSISKLLCAQNCDLRIAENVNKLILVLTARFVLFKSTELVGKD